MWLGKPGKVLRGCDSFRNVERNENKLKFFNRPVVVIYVVGGLTYGEISCLRKVAERNGIELLICVTKVINYKDFINVFRSL